MRVERRIVVWGGAGQAQRFNDQIGDGGFIGQSSYGRDDLPCYFTLDDGYQKG